MPQFSDKGRRWAIFSITAANFFLSQFYRASNAVIAPHLTSDLGLDTAALGLLSAAFFYAFALTQIPIGIFLDRVGARRMMTALSVVGVLGAVLFAFAETLSMGLCGRVLLGVGMACNLMGTLKLMTRWFSPRKFATLSGVIFSIGTAGNMAASTPLVFLVQRVGWRWAFLLIGAVNLVLAAALYAVVRDEPARTADEGPLLRLPSGGAHTLAHLGALVRNRDYWIISLGTFVGYGIFGSFQALWAGPYLMEVMGLSPLTTGNLILLLNVGMVAGGLFWGAFSDRVVHTRKWIIVPGLWLFALVILALSGLSVAASSLCLAVLFTAFGFVRSSGQLMYTHIKERVPLEMAGMAMTGVNFFTMIGPAAFLHGLGALMQYAHPEASRGAAAFGAAFALCVVSLVFAAVLYTFARDTRGTGS